MKTKGFESTLCMGLKSQMMEELNEIAKERELSRSDVIRDFLRLGIAQYRAREIPSFENGVKKAETEGVSE